MRRYALTTVVLVLFAHGVMPSALTRRLILHTITVPLAWSDSRVDRKLKLHLTRSADVRVILTEELRSIEVDFPLDHHNVDSLVNWGQEIGSRYLMVVDIAAERLERRKSFHVPILFHKYETVGVVEGELRLVDVMRGKLLTAEAFRVELRGPRIFQATMDDDINDPDVHISAPEKIRFFDRLEEKLSRQLVKRVRALIGGR